MNLLFEAIDPTIQGLSGSGVWLRIVDLLCVAGALFALLTMGARWGQVRRRNRGTETGLGPLGKLFSTLAIGILFVAIAANAYQVWLRYVEVNHFPSQTMSEVVVMFSWSLLVSMAVLHFALRLKELGPGWQMYGDGLLLIVFLAVVGTNAYTLTLSSAERDLPPALQSYWFPPHLVALIFSYATLGIAGLLCVKYFSIRFWHTLFGGQGNWKSQILTAALLSFVPFVWKVTLPIFLGMGAFFLVQKLRGRTDWAQSWAGVEKQWDQVSYRAFCVGIPFLTAGLFMGAFWAQEAWANYWGWDSKENSALITWLVYVVYSHLRMLGGYRGEKAMAVLAGGAVSVFLTFQLFGYLPDSQKSLHRYTDDNVVPREGRQGATSPESSTSARLEQQ